VPTQLVLEVTVLVVNRRVEAELIGKHLALLGTTGDPDDVRTLDLCDLADRRTDRAGGPGDQHGLARLKATHVQQPEIGGHAGNAQNAKVSARRNPLSRADLLYPRAVAHRMLGDTECA